MVLDDRDECTCSEAEIGHATAKIVPAAERMHKPQFASLQLTESLEPVGRVGF